jgi:hypothetical protein
LCRSKAAVDFLGGRDGNSLGETLPHVYKYTLQQINSELYLTGGNVLRNAWRTLVRYSRDHKLKKNWHLSGIVLKREESETA